MSYDLNLSLLLDEELIEGIQRHNYKAFKELVVRYSSDLFNFAFHFIYDVNLTKKVIYKIFLNIWHEPYLFSKNYKVTVYKKLNKLSLKNRVWQGKNDKLNQIQENILSLNNKNLSLFNLYYFSTLKSEELNLFFSNIDNEIKKLNSNIENLFKINILNTVIELNPKSIPTIEFQKFIILNVIKTNQKDKYQNIIVILAIIPIILLILIFLYNSY